MAFKRSNILYLGILCATGAGVAIILLQLMHFEREELIAYIVRLSNRPYLLNILRQQIITPQKFRLIKIACYVLLAIDIITVLLMYYYRLHIKKGLRFLYGCISGALASVIETFKQNGKKTNLVFAVLLAIITARSLYYMVHFELQYDEMWSYNYFTSRPFYFSIFSYNNYPLYELSTQLFKWLPFSMKANLRLPVVFAGISCCVIIYACLKNYTGSALAALAGMAAFACMPVTTFYMLYARGVIFELLFAAVSIFSILYMFKPSKHGRYLTLYVIANIAGMFSMPTHLYFWLLQTLCVFVYIVKTSNNLLKPFVLCSLLVLAISFICYLPVLGGSGLSFVLNAATNDDTPVNEIVSGIAPYTKSIGSFFTGYPYGLAIILGATIIMLAFFKKINSQNIFIITGMVLLFCMPALIYLLQHKALPERAVAFTGLIIPASVALLVFAFKDAPKPYAAPAFIGIFFIAGCVVSNNHSYMHWSEKKDRDAITISKMLMQHHVETCYDNSTGSGFFYFYPALEYYYSQQKRSFSLNMAAPNSLRYKPFLPADNYDCIVIQSTAAMPTGAKGYYPVYKDEEEGFVLLVKTK